MRDDPTGVLYTRWADTMRSIAQANAAYIQELMRANAALFSIYTERSTIEERPSDAVHMPDCSAP